MSEHEKIPVAAEKSTLTLKTIAACLIIIIPILVYGTRQYDAFLANQADTNTKLSSLIDHMVIVDNKLTEHEKQLDRIQASLDMAESKQGKENTRDRDYEEKN